MQMAKKENCCLQEGVAMEFIDILENDLKQERTEKKLFPSDPLDLPATGMNGQPSALRGKRNLT